MCVEEVLVHRVFGRSMAAGSARSAWSRRRSKIRDGNVNDDSPEFILRPLTDQLIPIPIGQPDYPVPRVVLRSNGVIDEGPCTRKRRVHRSADGVHDVMSWVGAVMKSVFRKIARRVGK